VLLNGHAYLHLNEREVGGNVSIPVWREIELDRLCSAVCVTVHVKPLHNTNRGITDGKYPEKELTRKAPCI